MQAKSGTAGGRVYPIARRIAATVCPVVYKVKQFGVNYMQNALRKEVLEK
jgi:hypothetical protein